MSSTWPPTIPAAPAARARRATSSARRGSGPEASRAKASVRSASPARMAIASPYTTWLVGRPRRSESSSIAGRSSCTRLYVWMYSSAQAASSAARGGGPGGAAASAKARQRMGRSRLPPASSEYSIDSTSRRGASASRPIRSASNASTRAARSSSQGSSRNSEGDVVIVRRGSRRALPRASGRRLEVDRAILAPVLEQLLHPALGLLEQLLALLHQLDALLELLQGILQAQLTVLELADHLLQAAHHLAVLLAGLGLPWHGSRLTLGGPGGATGGRLGRRLRAPAVPR